MREKKTLLTAQTAAQESDSSLKLLCVSLVSSIWLKDILLHHMAVDGHGGERHKKK